MLIVSGQTEDGKTVVSGIFRFYETHGLALDVILGVLEAKSLVPDWVSFYHEARHAGLTARRILGMLSDSISDVYGSQYRDVVVDRLTRYNSFVEEAGGA